MSWFSSLATTFARRWRSARAESIAELRASPAVVIGVTARVPRATSRRVRSRWRGPLTLWRPSCGGGRPRGLQAVADATNGHDGRGVPELLADLRDVHVDGARVAEPVEAPHPVEDLLAGEREP